MAKRLLIVEDDTFLSDLYKMQLSKEGYEVVAVEDGQQGLKIFYEQVFDMILLDIMMPKMSGFEMLERIRADKEHERSDVKVIVLTNLGQQTDKQRAEELGAIKYFVKTEEEIGNIIKFIKEQLG